MLAILIVCTQVFCPDYPLICKPDITTAFYRWDCNGVVAKVRDPCLQVSRKNNVWRCKGIREYRM